MDSEAPTPVPLTAMMAARKALAGRTPSRFQPNRRHRPLITWNKSRNKTLKIKISNRLVFWETF